ncbi:hypothetical protein [Brassicibacter mesophilus]|uniref:hypothetical protein n=1 Tax=Brassicibacter mesophilus TaxID=745119 RepID=UPI003D2560DC
MEYGKELARDSVLRKWLVNDSGLEELNNCIEAGCDAIETFRIDNKIDNTPDLYDPETDTYYEVVSVYTDFLEEKGYIHFRDRKLLHLIELRKTKEVKIVIVDITNKNYRIIDVTDIYKTTKVFEDLGFRYLFFIPQFGDKDGHRLYLDYTKFKNIYLKNKLYI